MKSMSTRSFGASPATAAFIALMVFGFLLSWLSRSTVPEIAFQGDYSRFWTLFTYPFADTGDGTGLFWFLLMLYWFYWVGSSSEGELGTAKFVGFFFAMAVVAALSIDLGAAALLRSDVRVFGPTLIVAALTVAWGTRNALGQVRLMFVIPVSGKILAWLTAALTVFGYGTMFRHPAMGLFAALHLVLAWAFASNKLPLAYSRTRRTSRFAKKTEIMSDAYYEDVRKREKDREERERLRKLFEGSLKDESDERKP